MHRVPVVHKLPLMSIWFKLQPGVYIKIIIIINVTYCNSHESYFKSTHLPCTVSTNLPYFQQQWSKTNQLHTFLHTPSFKFHTRIWLATVSEGPEDEASIRPSCWRAKVDISSVCPMRCLWVPEWRSSITTRQPLVYAKSPLRDKRTKGEFIISKETVGCILNKL